MSTIQLQNKQIAQRLFLPLQKLVAHNDFDPYKEDGPTELNFKLQITRHSPEDGEFSPALDYTKFNGTSGMKHPVSNTGITDYYMENPVFDVSNSSGSPECVTGDIPIKDVMPIEHTGSVDYPGMMCRSTHFKRQSELVISNALRTPTHSRSSPGNLEPQSAAQQGNVHYANEITIPTNGPVTVWDNNNRVRRSCSKIPDIDATLPAFDVLVPKIIGNNRINNSGIGVNSRDLTRSEIGVLN